MAEANHLTGLFRDRDSAEQAYRTLTERGYAREDIDVAMTDATRRRDFATPEAAATELGSKAAEGAGIGGAIGGTVGAIAAALAALGTSLALPGIGIVLAGPLAAALAGAGAGAATGGIVGALIGWGIPEERMRQCASELEAGGILLGVRPRSAEDADRIAEEWRHGELIAR